MKNKKIGLIGCGAVGSSFMYSAINQGLAQDYVLVDIMKNVAEGNKMDFEDAIEFSIVPSATISVGEVEDCKDCDVIVITSGRPQKPGETRLELLKDNAKIIADLATKLKKVNFQGISIIASNPCDVLATVYLQKSGFASNKVFSSGTYLDTKRFIREIRLNEKSGYNGSYHAAIFGEHGDSSIAYICPELHNISQQKLTKYHEDSVNKAYKIIEKKRATFYGIGMSLAKITKTIFNEEDNVLCLGAYDKDLGICISKFATVNRSGITSYYLPNLTNENQAKFDASAKAIQTSLAEIKK